MSNDDLDVQKFGRAQRPPTIKLEQLKEAALAATPGPGAAERNDHSTEFWFDSGYLDVGLAIIGVEYGKLGAQELADARFIADANPAVVLALIERLERAEAALADKQGGVGKQQNGPALLDYWVAKAEGMCLHERARTSAAIGQLILSALIAAKIPKARLISPLGTGLVPHR